MDLCQKKFVLELKKKTGTPGPSGGTTQQLNAMQTGEAEHLAEELACRRAGSSVARARWLAAWQARVVQAEAALVTVQTELAVSAAPRALLASHRG